MSLPHMGGLAPPFQLANDGHGMSALDPSLVDFPVPQGSIFPYVQSEMICHVNSDVNLMCRNPNVTSNPHVYMAVYSGVPVYEMMCRGIGVMRRRSDSYMNATQILKVAGVEKGKRTKILERDIVNSGIFEKVQGGYGRYQGTWIPFQRASDLAEEYGVRHLIQPLLDFMPAPPQDLLPNAGSTSTTPIQGGENGLTAPGRTVPVGHSRSPGLPIADGIDRKRGRDASFVQSSSASPSNKRPRVDETVPPSRAAAPVATSRTAPPMAAAPSARSNDLNIVQAPKAVITRSIRDDLTRQDQHRQFLHGAFGDLERDPNTLPPDLDIEVPLDEQHNTALHWAAGLARYHLLRVLISRGASIDRGNIHSETPLMRAVQTTNAHELDVFPAILDLLGPSLRLHDDAGRTALHHVVAVCGLRGRTPSARHYVETILEYVARRQGGSFEGLIEHEDKNGDTALHIAARVGNRVIARLLLGVGADISHVNKVGLRPSDFGLEGPVAPSVTKQESRYTDADVTHGRKDDVLAQIKALVTSVEVSFGDEANAKRDAVDMMRNGLRTAARDLSAVRAQLHEATQRSAEVEDARQRIRNCEKAIREEDSFDWTGRTELNGTPAPPDIGSAFAYLGPHSILTGVQTDPSVPELTPPADVKQLRRMVAWYRRALDLLGQRIQHVEGSNSELDLSYRKIIARSCHIPLDRVDPLLDQLVAALESEGHGTDSSRLAAFMSRVRAETGE